jgi:ferrochelatase
VIEPVNRFPLHLITLRGETTMSNDRRRVAVVLFNLGGPDGPADVQPFLRNLFRDPAIIAAPGLIRELLAWFISSGRAKAARANYALMGGGSPLLAGTFKQAEALEAALAAARPDIRWRIVVAMRYWRPYVPVAVAETRAWAAQEIVLLPLYPQFSTTTTGSSLTAWREAAPDLPARTVCCYPEAGDFIRAHASLIERTWRDAGSPANTRVLFSAHGLPESVIKRGDPYAWQVGRTVAAVAAALPPELTDQVICYQSRVGPMKWIGPSTEDEVRRAGKDGKAVLLSPIAFVSEHVETLVELDHEYAAVARAAGVARYLRTLALGVADGYVTALRDLALGALEGPPGLKPPGGRRLCPGECTACPNALG